MGRKFIPFYGDADVGSALEVIKKLIAKIKTNEFGKKDIIDLFKANTELLTAIVNDEYED